MKRSVFVVASALVLFAAFATACKSSDSGLKDRVSSLETQVQQVSTSSDNTSVVLALQAIAAAGLHAIDESANTDNEVVAGSAGPVSRAVQAMAAAQWPATLKSDADDLQATLQELSDALATDDVNQVKAPATAAHEASHEFTEAVNNALAPSLGLPTEPPPVEATGTPAVTPTP